MSCEEMVAGLLIKTDLVLVDPSRKTTGTFEGEVLMYEARPFKCSFDF